MKHTPNIALRCLTALLTLAPLAASAQMVIATDGNPPSFPNQAILEMRSTTSGMLVPRMSSVQRDAIAAGAPPNGLIVFVTSPPADVGYWYRDNLIPAWVPLVSGTGWNVPGNVGVVPADFVGTTSAQPFVLRTNNVERMRINVNSRVGIGTPLPPTEQVEVAGALRITGNTLTNTAGNIRWNAATSAHDGNIDGTALGWYQLENVLTERPVAPYLVVVPPACLPAMREFSAPSGGGTSSTIETPYSTLWESGRKQYVWRAAELAAAQICPDEPWTYATFNTNQGGVQALRGAEMKMKNTTSDVTNTIEPPPGWILVWQNALFTPGAAGWNTPHNFIAGAFSWNGSANVKMDFCFDNFNWTGSTGVQVQNTPGLISTYGIYCDACGGGAVPCGPYPIGHPLCQGFPCLGWGSVFGCNLLPTTNLASCDGDPANWVGGQGTALRRPQIRFGVTSGTIVPPAIVNDRYIWSDKALVLGTAAWAAQSVPEYSFKGPGTISAERGVYSNNVYLSDHIFDLYYDGEARPEDAARAEGYRRMGINEMVNYVERERHLPTIPGREEWNATGPFSMDKLSTSLWVTVEEQALYIKELNERLELMEQYLIKKRLREIEQQGKGKR